MVSLRLVSPVWWYIPEPVCNMLNTAGQSPLHSECHTVPTMAVPFNVLFNVELMILSCKIMLLSSVKDLNDFKWQNHSLYSVCCGWLDLTQIIFWLSPQWVDLIYFLVKLRTVAPQNKPSHSKTTVHAVWQEHLVYLVDAELCLGNGIRVVLGHVTAECSRPICQIRGHSIKNITYCNYITKRKLWNTLTVTSYHMWVHGWRLILFFYTFSHFY